ncbi:MAG: hypothetical protein HZA03_09595 [Nitrospinae bacterium]|nr:hypothetical protein [Nitrospinota bacterium]
MKFMKAVTVMGLVALLASCASAPPPPPKSYCTDGRELPAWTMQGAMAFPADIGKVFYGVGMASNISNPSLLRETADNRSISEMAKQFEVYTASLMNDYMASTSAADKASEEQHVEVVKKTVVKQTLNGVMIADRCQDRASGMFYSLSRLDMDKFKDAIAKKAELTDKMKEYVRANADKMLEKLEKEEAKR